MSISGITLANKMQINAGMEKVVCIGGTVAAIVALALIIIGSLGLTGAIQMLPAGGRIMVGIGVALLVGMIAGAIKGCCS